jgi:Zn-dependent protease with chaperone function
MADNSSEGPDYSILSGFEGAIAPPKTSFFYQCGLVLVAITMVLLVLCYVAIVVAVAALVYYHAVYDWNPIMGFGDVRVGRGLIIKFLIYVSPLLAGIAVVFFMFKPILARRAPQAQPLALNPAYEPLLYAFIEKICEIVGAPSPKRIDMDCQLNAAAGFRRGFLSFLGNDLVLIIGLPLAANLNARELAGVIAHEFGHFTQGVGMRLSYLIRTINYWFARVAYERDAWDVALERWSMESEDFRVTLVIWTVQVSVWFSRLILKILLFIGHLIGGFMLRQMEYDADAYHIKVGGSESFEETHRKLATLAAAWDETHKQLLASWKKTRTLPDNLPELLHNCRDHLSPQVVQKIDDTLGLERAGIFDDHPSPADRIRQARIANDPGIFHDDRPAASLFASFEHPSRYVTLLHYTDDLAIPITDQMLTHIQTERASAPAPAAVAATADKSSDAYFFGVLPLMSPIHLNPPAASASLESDYAEWSQLSAGLEPIAKQLEEFAQEHATLLDQLASIRAVQCLLINEVALPSGHFGFDATTVEAAATLEAGIIASRESLRHSLREIIPVLRRRFELGLALALANAGNSERHEISGERVAQLVSALNQDAEGYTGRQELVEALAVFDKINLFKAEQGESLPLTKALQEAEAAIRSLAAPFASKPEPAPSTPGTRIRITLPGAPIGQDLNAVREQNRQWLADYERKLDELVHIARSVESLARA